MINPKGFGTRFCVSEVEECHITAVPRVEIKFTFRKRTHKKHGDIKILTIILNIFVGIK